MKELKDEIRSRMNDLIIKCPECECMNDDQHTCTTCLCQGGNGIIHITPFLIDNPNF